MKCKPWEHELSRRRMLGCLGGAAGAGICGWSGLLQPAAIDAIFRNSLDDQRACNQLNFLTGLEMWFESFIDTPVSVQSAA